MSTFRTLTARLARLPRRGRAIAVPLLVAGALAAGCGTEHATVAGPSAVAGTAADTASTPAGSAAASPHPTPVPTVTGGPVAAGQPACVGWPAHARRTTMPALFVPVSVERCVTSIQTIAGKGQWETATLEKATTNLDPLIAALRHPVVAHPPEICPELAMLPPQLALFSASGQELIPLLPVSGCGLVQSAVLAAINALHWQPVSVRLVAPVASGVPTTGQTVGPPETPQPVSDQPGTLSQ